MQFIAGRNNLAVTVYVPYNCSNNCSFCESKNEYKYGTNIDKVRIQLMSVRLSSIKEVVFTGGEPMMNCNVLQELISIVDNKDVYINTSLINTNFIKFIRLVNDNDCIKGVNISRHAENFKSESLVDIVEDRHISIIRKPVKINVVLNEPVTSDFIKNVLNRWSKFDIKVSFRANFNDMTFENLHSIDDQVLQNLLEFGTLKSRTYCDICDTTDMTNGIRTYSYHRGMKTTSIKLGDTILVNDVIIFPDGQLCYDWDRKSDVIEDMKIQFGFIDFKDILSQYLYNDCTKKKNVTICGGCGSGGC